MTTKTSTLITTWLVLLMLCCICLSVWCNPLWWAGVVLGGVGIVVVALLEEVKDE